MKPGLTVDLQQTLRAGARLLTSEMRQAASEALQACWLPCGAMRAPHTHAPDLYYTLFGVFCCDALDVRWDREALRRHLVRPGPRSGPPIRADARRVQQLCGVCLAPTVGLRGVAARLRGLASVAFAMGAARRDAYAAFWGCLALEALGIPPPWPVLARGRGGAGGSTARVAARLVVLTRAGRSGQPEGRRLVAWLQARRDKTGGYATGPLAPAPDLLSTAVAIFALTRAGVAQTPSELTGHLAFVSGCATPDGFWADRPEQALGDCEFGFYALLALGACVAPGPAARGGVPTDWSSRPSNVPQGCAQGAHAVWSEVHRRALSRLLAERAADGCWRGHLSSSALATALATAALEADPAADTLALRAGRDWLVQHANADGGWGDSPESPSNLSTTALTWAMLALAPHGSELAAVSRAADWLQAHLGCAPREGLADAVKRFYGRDRTFSAPILFYLALRGRLGTEQTAWPTVPGLPFALALLPSAIYPWLRLQVVSYALPALIAVGLCRHLRAAAAAGRAAWGRRLAPLLLRRLARLQPASGGFLEAVPLTAFTVLAVAGAGYDDHPVVARGRAFLRAGQRADGSWPIDTDLGGWLTSLAVHACHVSPGEPLVCNIDWRPTRDWLVRAQHRTRHPYTQAHPGGWAWTDASGGVPDADDTAGALLALAALVDVPGSEPDAASAGVAGVRWLLQLQNRDGGIPTFCRGWGRLPFDRSCADLTAHALRAWLTWRPRLPRAMARRTDRASARAVAYLRRTQAPDGCWVPLWFGSQARSDGLNPVIGTARVIPALRAASAAGYEVGVALDRAEAFLLAVQAPEGGWGSGTGCTPTMEETGLVVTALAPGGAPAQAAAARGADWLAARLTCAVVMPQHDTIRPRPPEGGTTNGAESCEDALVVPPSGGSITPVRPACELLVAPAPIGLYFAKLWYSEDLYPLVWAIEGLGSLLRNSLKETAHEDARLQR